MYVLTHIKVSVGLDLVAPSFLPVFLSSKLVLADV